MLFALPFSGAKQSLIKSDFQTICLVLALAVYAIFGSPTPDVSGVVEVVIGLLLIASVGVRGAFLAINKNNLDDLWAVFARFLLFFGFSLPFLIGFFNENSIFSIFRDFFAFVFLIFPVFYQEKLTKNRFLGGFCPFLAIFIGVCFAVRALMHLWELRMPDFMNAGELAYFANTPTVLFTALFLLGLGFCRISGIGGMRRFCTGVFLVLLACIPLAAMAFSLQRATMGAVIIYLSCLGVIGVRRAPYKTLPVLAGVALAFWLLLPFFDGLWETLHQKTVLVGVNMRFAEAVAVWEKVSAHPLSLLFGFGWGADFVSPAVGELHVNFTHSLLTSMLLKTGLFGLFLTLFYLAALIQILMKLVLNVPVIGLALAAPILINIFLYASYKSLDFGLVLLLIPLMHSWMLSNRNQEQVKV